MERELENIPHMKNFTIQILEPHHTFEHKGCNFLYFFSIFLLSSIRSTLFSEKIPKFQFPRKLSFYSLSE